MRILFIAMSSSIHTARWLKQISDQGWDLHLFPSLDDEITHPEINNVTVHHMFYRWRKNRNSKVRIKGTPLPYSIIVMLAKFLVNKLFPNSRTFQLHRLIKKIKPDIIHSMELQHAGYLTMDAIKSMKSKTPPWIISNWGSDIYLFGKLAEHEPKITEVLSSCDYYFCECERDVHLAKSYGLRGKVLPVFPNTGGFDIPHVSSLRRPGPVSARRIIMLKGYQGWSGRALVALRALERCVDLLDGYEVHVHSAVTEDVFIAVELFQKSTGIPVNIIPKDSPHDDILRYHGQARLSIGLSISDAISTSLLEAMAMGSFPIQSWTACANEWIEDGRTGLLVPPDDPDIIEQAICRAITDDDLVNRAAKQNYRLVEERLDQSILKPQAVDIYNTVVREKGITN